MDFNVYQNLTENGTLNPNASYIASFYHMEIPLAITVMLSTISNALIIIVVIKFPIMHTRLYYYVGSWCTCNFLNCVSLPATLNILGFARVIPESLLCIWNEIDFMLMLGNFSFVAIILIDWYIMTFVAQSHCARRCRRFHKAIIVIVWITLLSLLVPASLWCLDSLRYPVAALMYFIGYVFAFSLVIVLLFLRLFKLKTSSVVVEKNSLEFKLVVGYFLCWLPNILVISDYFLLPRHYMSVDCEYLSYIIGYFNACVTLVLLYYYEKNFRTCFCMLLNIHKYQAEDDDVKEAHNTCLISS